MKATFNSLLAWWQQLGQREQLIVGVGGSITAIFLIYTLLWQPLQSSKQHVVQHVQQQQQLLSYMKRASNKIMQLRQQGASITHHSNQPLLATIDQSTRKQQLADYISTMTQNSNGEVNINFKQVPFTHMLRWLQSLWSHHGISTQQITVKAGKISGTADVSISLNNSST